MANGATLRAEGPEADAVICRMIGGLSAAMTIAADIGGETLTKASDFIKLIFRYGAPGTIRTSDPQIRSLKKRQNTTNHDGTQNSHKILRYHHLIAQ